MISVETVLLSILIEDCVWGVGVRNIGDGIFFPNMPSKQINTGILCTSECSILECSLWRYSLLC